MSASVQPAQQPDFLSVSPLPASQITHKRTEGKRGQTAALQDFFSARPEAQPRPEPQAPQLSLAEIAELRAQQYARLSVAAPTPFHAIPDNPTQAHAQAADDGLLSDVVAAAPAQQPQKQPVESKYRPDPIAPLQAQTEPAPLQQPVLTLAPAASPAVFAPVSVSVSTSVPAAPLAALPVAVVSPQPASDAAPIPAHDQPLLPPPAQEEADWFCPQCTSCPLCSCPECVSLCAV